MSIERETGTWQLEKERKLPAATECGAARPVNVAMATAPISRAAVAVGPVTHAPHTAGTSFEDTEQFASECNRLSTFLRITTTNKYHGFVDISKPNGT